jgi:phage replication O-like protein O
MANPQKENGNTQIANELLEAIVRSGLNGTELSVVFHIIRKTYGWNKTEDQISISQFLNAIPVSKPTLCAALKVLQLVRIIKLVKKGNSKLSSNVYQLNKDYESWQLVKKSKLVKISVPTSKEIKTQLVRKPLHTKDTLTKDNIQKTIPKGITEQAPKVEYGNIDINKMLEALKGKIGIDDFADSQKWSRIYGKHCISLMEKIGKEEFIHRLDVILRDSFKKSNCNSIKYVYGQLKGFIAKKSNSVIIQS